MHPNRLLQAVRAGIPAIGPQLWTGNPAVVELMGHHPFQWVGIDLEHSPYTSYEQVGHLCRAAELAGLTPIASIGMYDVVHIAHLSEVGIMGFIVAHTITGEDASRSVEAAKYPPAGRRGAAPAVRQLGYGLTTTDWAALVDRINQETVVIGKVEDIEALDHLDDLLRSPIDGLMVGAFDLSHSVARRLGMPEVRGNINHPAVAEARDRVFAKCKEHGKFAAAVLTQLEGDRDRPAAQVFQEWIPRGVLVYALTHELGILGDWYQRMAQELGLS
jgi:4-hydroxy-2-oxoheptanedioate aldolase